MKKNKRTARQQAEIEIREELKRENEKYGTSKMFIKFRKESEFDIPMRVIVNLYLREQAKKNK